MTVAEILLYLSVVPDNAEITIADYVGDDIEIGDLVYFPKERVVWIRTADMVADMDEEPTIEDETSELSSHVLGPTLFPDSSGILCLPNPKDVGEAINVEVVPVDVIKPRGRQRAA